MEFMSHPVRDSARVLLLDPSDRVLLIQILGGDLQHASRPLRKPFWVTPGGKMEEGEAAQITAAREIREETGLSDFEVGAVVWYGEHILLWKGVETLLRERFLLARAKSSNFTTSGMSAAEKEVYRSHRWWSVDEICESDEIFIPRRLGTMLRDLLELGHEGAPKVIDLSEPLG